MFLHRCVFRKIQPNPLLKILSPEFHLGILRIIWTLGYNTHALVSLAVYVNIVVVRAFELLADPVQPRQVLRAHHCASFTTLVTDRVGLTEQDHGVDPPSLVAVLQDLCDALESTLLFAFFIIVTIFALARSARHIVVHDSLLVVARLEVLFFELVVFNKLVGAAVVCISFVKNVLAHLVKGLGNIQI